MIEPSQQTGEARDFPIFGTQNQALAVALMSCGCAPANPREPLVNIYDESHPFIPSPGNPRLPARRGEVTFAFEGTDYLRSLVDAWDDEVGKIAAADKQAAFHAANAESEGKPPECVSGSGTVDLGTPEGAIRFAAHVLKIQGDVKDWWRSADPKIRFQKPGSPVKDGDRTTHPGFIVVSRNAKPATLRRLGINPERL